ncbi:unnamed protein product [Didymodactylos carnosus]|uniref:Uncharacterized protein n=1 Tax=Didymodactylos carnosus TaxID=1234261 RepID=A0A814CFC8_9BILA|nr:unnamed protein product [Didymodactylos carnosus]CAF0942573.1 unnamed protein product [Didymodactylos carnosus]CAF3711943.1 unnamed protein product [Didymodactylos carnosus]CAF3718916.1 unnamed protein product [Didymodactylos carnosus]
MIPAATTLYVPAAAVANQQQRYFVIQPTPIVSAVPVFNGPYVYPSYGFVPKVVETSFKKEDIEQQQNTQEQGGDYYQPHRSRSRSKSPPQHHRMSRRDEYEQDQEELHVDRRTKHDTETIDEKIQRIRRELGQSNEQRHDKSVGTIDHYKPPQQQQYVHYRQSQNEQQYSSETNHQRQQQRSRSRSRSRSLSRPRSAGPREPWRSSNLNDYPWRDSHLPAYREHTLEKQQDFDSSQSRPSSSQNFEGSRGSSHSRSHSNQRQSTYQSQQDYVYRPKSETEAKKWYTQSTGKDPDREVYQMLRGGTTTYSYNQNNNSASYGEKFHVQHNGNSSYHHHQPSYDCSHSSSGGHAFYSDIPKPTKSHTLKKLDSTQHHTLYGCNEPCLHIVPKQGGSFDPPYVKIVNAPVTYLH